MYHSQAMPRVAAGFLLATLLLAPFKAAGEEALKIGSKRFTESYILGEVLLRAASARGPAVLKAGLGNTGIVYAALRAGSIDVYPEYTGTIAREILKLQGNPDLDHLNRALAQRGMAASIPLGFSNNYALGVRGSVASRLRISSVSELALHPSLRLGLSQEFLARADGWPGLSRAYGLQGITPIALDHGLAYEALKAGRVDVIDLYSTDPKIASYGIKTLADDRGFFPRYEAVLLHRADTPARFPAQWQALSALESTIDESTMMRMNAAAELEGRSFADAAGLAFSHAGASPVHRDFWHAMIAPDLGRLTVEHLLLVFGSLVASILVGIPLGAAAAKSRALAQPILALVGVIQTIPSLALLAFLIALMGIIGTIPALIALFLYALLPIVRNTHAGLAGVGEGLIQAARALGLSARDRLWHIELPLAQRSILAGVKTSAVINVGTATIAAFIGAGGYGDRILAGLALNDHAMLLAGAVPAAVMALAIQAVFELLERHAARGLQEN